MSPISYQGPMASDEGPERTHSQTKQSSLGAGQPGLTVSGILADKGDEVFTVTPHQTVMELVAELHRLRVGALVVVDHGNRPVGIVSERDVVRNIDRRDRDFFDGPVADIMTPDPQTCSLDDTVEVIMKRMTEGRFRHLPAVEDGELRGLVSIGDVVRHRMLEIEYENLKMKQAIVG